jgi:RimJ/RimL family protein N-acetyltransferase
MSTARHVQVPAHYELRVVGHLDPRWSSWFDGLVVTHEPGGTTSLRGLVSDQAALHGLLARVRDLGAPLVSLTAGDTAVPAPANCQDELVGSPLDAIAWPVHTERLMLRPATPADLEATWRFRRLDEVSRWLTRAPRSIEDHRVSFEDPASLVKTIIVENGGEVIGDLMLQVEDAWAQAEVADRARGVQAELGWVLHPDHAGQGYATEAVRELIRLAFEDLGLRRLTANCFAANTSSQRLMERVGMRREVHTLRESLHRSGEWLDGMGYALLAEEWREGGRAGAVSQVHL